MFKIVKLLSDKYGFDYDDAIELVKSDLYKLEKEELIENPSNLLILCGNEETEKENLNYIYNNKPHYLIDKLKPNNKGNIGENFIYKLCNICNITNEYNGTKNKNSDDGTFDILINSKRCEIKTACQGKKGTFQHETLRNEGCDFYIFVSICPSYSYITILPKFNLNENCYYMSSSKDKKQKFIKPHLRKGASNVYKFDFSEKHILQAIQNDHSIKLCNDENNSFDFVKDFFTKKIV